MMLKNLFVCAALLAITVAGAVPQVRAEDPDWCNLQWPAAVTTEAGVPTEQIFGQVFEDGVTPLPGATPGLQAQLGFGPDGSLPSEGTWTWVAVAFNADAGNNDEFVGTLTVNEPGIYDYAYRYRFEGGNFCYGDLDGSANGYDPEQAGDLTVTGSPVPSSTPTIPSTELPTKTPTPTPSGPTATPTVTNTPSGDVVDWCNLQYPPTMQVMAGMPSELIYGQVLVNGVTPGEGQGAGVTAEVGYGPVGSYPDQGTWIWFAAEYNTDAAENDEYQGSVTIPDVGFYAYAYRYIYLGGEYCYGDLDGSGNGYSPTMAGAIEVMPYETPGPTSTPSGATPTPPPSTQWCNLQWPPTMTSLPGEETEPVYGQVYQPDVTDKPGQGLGITAELGYGPDGVMPWDGSWMWTEAAFNLDAGNNDEYMAMLTVPTSGTYDYAYRYSLNGGTYCYGDLNGSDDGYSADQAGGLTVLGGGTPTPEPGTPTPTNTTGPGTPTNTPLPATATPTPTNTTGPGTPTYTPLPSTATPRPTNTTGPGTPTNTPLPSTATPTPTQIPVELGVVLEMPDTYYTPNETCYLNATLNNPGAPLTDVALVVLLDINVGEYWFWPGWKHYPPDVDFQIRTVFTGSETVSIIPPFSWPTGAGSFADAKFYGGLLNSSITELIGNLGSATFGFGE